MKQKIRKSIAVAFALLLTAGVFFPVEIQAETAAPAVGSWDTPVVQRNGAYTHFTVYVKNAISGAAYTASVSDKDVAQVVNAKRIPGIEKGREYVYFDLYAKKSGKVKVTVRQTYKDKTKKIGAVQLTVKSKKFSAKENAKEKRAKRILKSGSDPKNTGVSLEVLKVSGINNTSKKVTATVTLEHKVTADEMKLSGGNFNLGLWNNSSDVYLRGKLKKGSDKVTVTVNKNNDWVKKSTKKGTKYNITGLRTKKSSPYVLKVKL